MKLLITTLYGPPSKIIWLRTGNLSNDQLVELLVRFKLNIDFFINDEIIEAYDCLAIYASGTAHL